LDRLVQEFKNGYMHERWYSNNVRLILIDLRPGKVGDSCRDIVGPMIYNRKIGIYKPAGP